MLDHTDLTRALQSVTKPVASARGLPNTLYTSDEGFALERQRIFQDGWACAGFGADVPDKGDAKPIDFLGIPLLLLAISPAPFACSRMSAAIAA